jgi:integrase
LQILPGRADQKEDSDHGQIEGQPAVMQASSCLGLRVSEIRALQWQDFDLKRRILTLARSSVRKYVWNGGKTGASEDEVALDSKLVSVSGGLAEEMCTDVRGLAICECRHQAASARRRDPERLLATGR